VPNSVRVEGYTDDVPIKNSRFRSNWDLSAARAATLVHQLIDHGVDPLRLSLAGYGEYRPVADNATEEGRAKNRRVVLVVLATPDALIERELAPGPTGQAEQAEKDGELRLPAQAPSAQSILSASQAEQRPASQPPSAPAPAAPPATAPQSGARWPAERRAAGEVPPFVPAPPPPPQVSPF
jgi:chemotaxis protein MotB